MGLRLRRRPAPPQAVEGLALRGRLTLTVVGPDGRVRDRREGDNVICTAGYTALAAAMVWSGLQDQAVNIGVTAPTFLTPLWGAIGTGAGTVNKADTALFAEASRQTVGAGASTPATGSISAECTWLFYFPSPASTLVVTEAGAFAGGTSTPGSGTLLDHWAFSPSITVPTTDSLILQISIGLGP